MAAVPVNTTIQTQIANLYIAILGRNPEPTGFGYWCDTLANNGGTAAALNAITLGFSNSPEFIATYGGRTTSSAVSLMYNNVLDRAPDSNGLTYWTNIANAYIAQGYTIAQAYALTGNAIITAAAANTGTADQALIEAKEAAAIATGTSETYTLTTSPDTATAVTFLAPKAYNPGGTDLVNTLQNEDVLTGNTFAAVTLGTVTSLTGDLGNPNDSGASVIAPTMTDVQTINIAFTNTVASGTVELSTDIESQGLTLDFQDITGTTTANMTRISNNLRDSFVNLKSEVANLGISNTSEAAKATITYLNNDLTSASDEVTLTLNNASLSSTQSEYAANGAALKIEATVARGSDLQHQIENYNIVTAGTSGSTVATLKSGVSDYNDLVVGQRPVTFNITTGATASLAIGTLRWLGNRVETNSANAFQAGGNTHQVGTNGLGFVDISQITAINVAGASNVTLANVGTWNSLTLGGVVSSIDASTLTGNLTADISNAASASLSSFTGGLGNDRFYVANVSSASVVAEVSGGGAGTDSLTVQSDAGGTVNLAAGSDGMDVLNLVQGDGAPGSGGVWSVDYTNGGFVDTTFDNQSAVAMAVTLTDFDASTSEFSIRSTGFNSNGDPVTTGMGAVNLTMTQAAGVDGGTVTLYLGNDDDRSTTNAFSHNNYTAAVSLIDNGTAGANALDSLNLVVNTAGDGGTSALALTVVNSDFETSTTLSSNQAATNTVNIGYQAAAGSSDYSAALTNGLNSTTYDGSAYLGQQNVTFGSVNVAAATNESFNITTGSANGNTVDLSFMGTNADRTAQGFALSSYLLNTVVDLGTGTGNELILSATLADPRVVITPDATYDGYFANWTGVDTLTINNRNGINTATVGVDAYAQINNGGLNTINFNDVSGTFVNGFRFTNDVTINVDAVGAGTNQQAAKTTTINSLSEGDIVLNVDESAALPAGGATGNSVVFTSTGASLGNNVTLNYTGLTNAATVYDSTTLFVTAGSLDTVTWTGDLGAAAAASGTIAVTTAAGWTAANETTAYNFAGVVNTLGATSAGSITFTAAAETDATGLTITGSSAGGTSTGTPFSVVNNLITGSAGADTITTAGYQDVLVGGLGADTITYTGASSSFTTTNNTVSITGDLAATAGGSADTITILNMAAGETATVNAGAGNDVVTLGLETDTYTFASVATVAITAPTATVSQTVLNVGTDTITNFQTATDGFVLDTDVFGTTIGPATQAITAGQFSLVATADALVGAIANNGIVVVQAGTNAAASIYYIDNTVVTGTNSVNELIQMGDATLIGQVSNVTGAFSAADFVIA